MEHWENIKNLPSNMRILRERRRRRMTRAERIVGWSLAMLPPILVFAAVLLLLDGGSRALGIGLLVLGLVMMSIPVAPILGARVRRREARRK
jgi:hypothetical protein